MLASQAFQNVKVMAFRHPVVGAPGVGFHGGPVLLGADQQILRHTRYHQPVDWFDGYEGVTARLAGDYVYVGPVYHHFGHVMAEMVHRLLPSQAVLPGRRLLFSSTVGDAQFRTASDLPGFLQEVLCFFGVKSEQLTFLNADHAVDSLFVAQQGSDFGGGPRPGYLDLLADMTDRFLGREPGPSHDKVYVSRSALPGGGGVLGEQYLESALESVGFFIARPELMTVRDQMRLYRQARVVVFAEGSACHGVELLGTKSLGTVILLARREDHMGIFDKVLSGRSVDYIPIKPAQPTISVLQTMKHITLGPVAFRSLQSAFLDRSICASMQFDERAYSRACEADFHRHIDHYRRAYPTAVDSGLIAKAYAAFAATWH